MAKDAYYFSHDANAHLDEKIIELRMDLGWEGYGVYWAIIETLRNASNYKLEMNYNRIAFALNTDSNLIKTVVENYKLFNFNEGFFFSESLLKRMLKKDAKSNKARESALARWNKLNSKQSDSNANALNSQCDSNANKRKESKEKEKKVNKTKVNKTKETDYPFELFWNMYDKKVGRPKCEKKYEAISEQDRVLIFEHVLKYIEAQPDKKYRKNPETYLNQNAWHDEIVGATQSKTFVEQQLERQSRKGIATEQEIEEASKHDTIIEHDTDF